MAFPFQQSAFTLGEVSPGLFGRQDLARTKVAASTMRNGFPKFSGGYYSRAGTAFVGFSKQTGRDFPPRLITFQFSINQGLALEFGDFYMRVIKNGAYVTETPLPISGITNSNPGIVSITTNGATAATPLNAGVTASYAPGDFISLAGGTFAVPATLAVTTTHLLGLHVLLPGGGVYAPADTIHLTGGTQTTAAILTVATTKVVSATITAGGAGGTNGTATVTGTTGTGTRFQANVTISGGAITAVNYIALAGSYSVNPTTPAAEPVTGAGLAGAQLNVQLGVLTFAITNAGVFTANSTGGTFTQASTSGSGTGATFTGALMGIHAVTVHAPGGYSVFPPNPVLQASTTGSGMGAAFNVTWANTPQPFVAGDWVNLSGVAGMTQVNNETYVVHNPTATTFEIFDIYGNPVDTTSFTPYASGGLAARIYTTGTPYSEQDLQWLKWAQSADTMTFCCLNQETNAVYQPYDLTRHSDTNWSFAAVVAGESIDSPSVVNVAATGGVGNAFYLYAVTAVAADGSESVPTYGQLFSAIDIAATPGSVSISWGSVPGAVLYNVYKAAVTYDIAQNIGMPIGLIAPVTDGVVFIDSNVVPNFTIVPPTHKNPFPTSSDFPSTVSYVQERRVFADTLNQPDTYFMSQPGAFRNFDTRTPTIDSDAITGAPWSVQVDGIQWMIDRPGGLVVLTGREAWQLTGPGGSSLNPQALTPANQQAQPQAFNGAHNHFPPVVIGEDIIYLQSKGSIFRDLTYQFYQNIYTGADLTLNSSHLFTGLQMQEGAWTEEPYKIFWVAREDGILLSLTYLKAEQIAAWARHDTAGFFATICAVTELPVDALYTGVKRTIGAHTAYTIERMNDRIWNNIDDAWCVDCGRALAQPEPAATLIIGSAVGAGTITLPVVAFGGSGWTAGTQISVVDDQGLGSGTGAVLTPIIVGGVITGLTVVSGGSGYSRPRFYAYDPAGSEGGQGFLAACTLDNSAMLTATAAVFDNTNIGNVVRAAGGIATITQVLGTTQAIANVTSPFTRIVPDGLGGGVVPPVASGNWTMTAPVTRITGLNYLIGATVTGVADGNVIPPQVVAADGSITLSAPASNVVLGLSFTAQLQSIYLDPPGVTEQGQRKKVPAVVARIEASRGFEAGSNQVDGSTLSPMQIATPWNNMTVVPDGAVPAYGSSLVPLFTGNIRVTIQGGFEIPGQVAFQQRQPLPLNVLSFAADDQPGDPPQMKEGRGQKAEVAG